VCSGGSRKKYLGAWPLISFGRQQRLSEITIEPQKIWGRVRGWTRFGGPLPPGPNVEPPLAVWMG